VRYVPASDGQEVLFCNCKHSADKPFCDGAHNNLRDTYDEDDPHSEHNLAIPEIGCDDNGRALLDGGCYVCKVDRVPLRERGTLRLGTLISAATGAQFQSQFYAEADRGTSPVMAFGDSHVVILVTAGRGRIVISGQAFDLSPEMGVYVQPTEAFAVSNADDAPIKLFISVCPNSAAPQQLPAMPDNFNRDHPQRTVGIDPDNRQAMGDRFFQVLVDERIGSSVVTQFIGEVPQSKAAPHRHLYEESIVVLRGEGCMWTERLKTPVAAGDVIFLPRKQIHSLQCTDPGGMLLAGVIYPGNNPSINY
jgi:quercetin dioxygenase-like cupin family protein